MTPETAIIHQHAKAGKADGAIGPSIHLSTAYTRTCTNDGYESGRVYSRDDNPDYKQVEDAIALLENGEEACLFSSGMAAINAVFLSLPAGSHIVAPKIAYLGVLNWLENLASRWGYSCTFYDNNSLESLENAIQPDTKLVWIETPGNPTWPLTDIQAASVLAKKVGALVVVDNTVPTPYHTKPLDLGADMVVHSATKTLNGHHDVVAGVLVTKDADSEHWQSMKKLRCAGGAVCSTFDTYLLARGLQTFHLRAARASANALALAQWLEMQDAVKNVIYPGLPSHPQHALAKKQMQHGYGSMLSFTLKGGKTAALDILKKCTLFSIASSLGGTHSLIEHRATVEDDRATVPQDMLRISCGIENIEDLIGDLKQTLL